MEANQLPAVSNAELLANVSSTYRAFMGAGMARLRAASITQMPAPVRDLSAPSMCDVTSSPLWKGCVVKEAGVGQGYVARRSAGSSAIRGALATGEVRCEEQGGNHKPEEPEQVAATQLQVEGGTIPGKRAPRAVRRSCCRRCGSDEKACRMHNRIQWCEAQDDPFDEWIANAYPAKKADTAAAAAKRAARIGMPRGKRPTASTAAAKLQAQNGANVSSRSVKPMAGQQVCRCCQRSDTQCRRHGGIYFCEAEGLLLEEWKRTVFPAKKAAAQEARIQRSAQATGTRGRPKSKKSDPV